MKNITKSAFAALIGSITAPTEVQLLTRTPVKASTPWGNVTKESRIVGTIGFDYEATVRVRQVLVAGIAPTFAAGKRPWGKRVNGSLIEHKGNFYVETLVNENRFPRYVGPTGQEIAPAEMESYLPARASSKKQTAAGLNKNQVHPACYNVNNIISAVIGGVQYNIVG